MTDGSLAGWHRHLDSHFRGLRAERDRLGQGGPLFALEHGLDLDHDLPDLNAAVRVSVAGGRLPTHSWLPFVVYAAEIGYRYQGDEYWPVFEADTPRWRQRGAAARVYIRRRYETFAASYGGAVPSGAWAAWFKNIAWPITHAILPTDLQRHLARLLYDYRHALTTELLDDHEALGERLARRSGDTSTRFRKFAENSSLLGLVAASLLPGDEEETPLLMQSVLHRIVVDLSHERQAGVWLRDAKRAAVQVRRRGLLSSRRGAYASPVATDADPRWPRLEVELSLRRTSAGWTLYLAVPSHESLAQRFPSLREDLERVRYRVDGVNGVQPRGALMYRRGPLALTELPTNQRSVLSIEGGSDALAALLADHCRFPPGPWLFRLREPGLASEVRTNFVRPGFQYILLSREAPTTTNGLSHALPLRTQGAHALLLDVPEQMDDGIISRLRQLDVGAVSEVIVWPAGLVPARWDGEGRAAWPVGESPIIGVRSSRSAARCVVSTEDEVAEFSWPENSEPLFIQLRDPGVGSHTVDVALLGDGESGAIAEGRLLLRLLEPADSATRAGARQGLQVRTYPSRPTLEELWTGGAAIVADGPHGEKVQFATNLMNRGGRRVLAYTSFSSALPVSEERWRELLRGARGSTEFASVYGEAEEMAVSVSNPALGSSEIRAERPFEPLRWCTGHDRDGPYARLIDHLGSDELVIEYFDAPTPSMLACAVLDDEERIRTSNGGLVLARAGAHQAAVVLPPHISGGLESLKKLSVHPSLQTGPRSAESVLRMIDLAHLWTRLSVPGDENAVRLQSQVNDAIVARLSGMIAGSTWWELERDLLNGRRATDQKLLDAISGSPKERLAASQLLDLSARVGQDPPARSAAFGAILGERYWKLIADLSDLILRLATVPGSLATNNQEVVTTAIDEVLQRPALHRLARLFVVALGTQHGESGIAVLRSWPWD